jgi:deoxyribodipyrimidine photo-lyase
LIIEPSLWAQPDAAMQHYAFMRECADDLAAELAALGLTLTIKVGEAVAVLKQLHATLGSFTLRSFEETGNWASFMRDRAVSAWAGSASVPWIESPGNGVVRRLKDRNQWSKHWMRRMQDAPLLAPAKVRAAIAVDSDAWPTPHALGLMQPDKAVRQHGGRTAAIECLAGFLNERGGPYRRAMSSPLSAQSACSRISPYLAWGCLSIREVVQTVWTRRARIKALPKVEQPAGMLASLTSFEGRLHWHCHFIQKLESEPQIEFRNVHRGFDGLRNEGEPSSDELVRLKAWREGRTGYPMVDACMRMVNTTGWLNFRMRAMLVSFASYQLWLHWRATGLWLAQQFLDYEPGIHWTQFQMQSGVTGINTIRMYNAVKQAQDHDPEGIFVRRWCPELALVPDTHIFEPWRMPGAMQAASLCIIGQDYPAPIVDQAQAMKDAKEKIYARRQNEDVRQEAARVFDRHGSRNPNREGVKRRSARKQAGLDVDEKNPAKPKPLPQLSLFEDE